MDRYRRVAQFWSWLPAFRGVAEYESIHGAAAVLATSPSALSRTVKLLEDAVGEELFTRDKQSLALTPLGARLLGVIRDSMRAVDDCIEEARTRGPQAITVGATSELALSVVEASLLDGGLLGAPPLRTRLLAEEEVEPALLRGDVDLVVASAPPPSVSMEIRAQGTLTLGMYAGTTHPLAARAGVLRADDLSAERTVGAADELLGAQGRLTSSTVGSLASALLVCSRSHAIAMLPDAFVAAFADKAVVRLCDAESTLTLAVVTRARLEGQKTPWLDALSSAVARAFRA